MQIEINNRLYNEIVIWCVANNIDIPKYINNILNDRFMLDKYGDINKITNDINEKKEAKPKKKKEKNDDAAKEIINNDKGVTNNTNVIEKDYDVVEERIKKLRLKVK